MKEIWPLSSNSIINHISYLAFGVHISCVCISEEYVHQHYSIEKMDMTMPH